MPTNQELVQKAIITTDALATAGKLNPTQADKFIDYVLDETALVKTGVRTVKFTHEKMLIEKINVAQRVAVPAEEAADPGLRRGVTTSKIELQPKEIMVPFEIGDLFKDQNIEGNKVEDHIIKMMAKRMANNIEQLYLNGNALGPAAFESDLIAGGSTSQVRKDTYLGLFDGLLAAAEAGHIVDALNGDIKPSLISRALRQMPNKFRTDRRLLKMWLSWDHEQAYREGVSTRATGSGDSALAGTQTIPSFGVDLLPLSLLDANPQYVEHVVLSGTTAVALKHAPISNVVVAPSTLGTSIVTPYINVTDYTLDLTAGTIARTGGGAITNGQTVKVTYNSAGRALLTMPQNIVVAIGKDITIEKDRNIYKRVNEFAMTAKIYITFEEIDAVVLVKNIKVPT